MAAGYDIGLSGSSSTSTSGYTGDVTQNSSTGGGKQTSLALIVIGVVAVLGFIAWMVIRRKK